ncbi:chorismate mutase [Babesia caballi]|uniref:Chorismate mutase n=1 Tax=Babesia caballi TaxID=5871 RepID=A0AAV4LTR2_BABCB|nr:chorismate mutase [Babesia caballi]
MLFEVVAAHGVDGHVALGHHVRVVHAVVDERQLAEVVAVQVPAQQAVGGVEPLVGIRRDHAGGNDVKVTRPLPGDDDGGEGMVGLEPEVTQQAVQAVLGQLLQHGDTFQHEQKGVQHVAPLLAHVCACVAAAEEGASPGR